MTDITLYNTKTRQKERFEPLDPNNVRLYVCGPTVYDRAHLGNARPVIVFDMLFRLLRYVYGPDHVTYVRNFTDVDDKIIARAQESGQPIDKITSETSRWYLEDMAAVGALEPTAMPRATAYIGQMQQMISELISRDFAYVVRTESNNPPQEYVLADREEMLAQHALFEVEQFEKYGDLSRRKKDAMIAEARIEKAPYKRSELDFVLWKPAKDGQPGWDSPWGRGRPGWHIECSAMAKAVLGKIFDIHGGGRDLMFPHHENEIAQSCCANETNEMARFWMHNEMLQVEGKKMSKSLGNFFTVRDLLDQGVPGEVIRFVMLSTHYRKPMDWTEKKRAEAEATLRKWYSFAKGVRPVTPSSIFFNSLKDDLNTPGAISALHSSFASGKHAEVRGGLELLGMNFTSLASWADPEGAIQALDEGHRDLVQLLVYRRHQAKLGKDFETADHLRDALIDAGVNLKDQKDSVATWDLTSNFDPAKLEALK